MARARSIKPGFFCNDGLVELPFEVRLLFIGLWTLADREGRLEDRPKRIRAQIFPYDNVDVDKALDQLQAAGFVVRYEAEGTRCLQVVNFVKHQMPHHKEAASELPPLPGEKSVTRHPYNVPPRLRDSVFDRDGRKCLRCGSPDDLSIDHVVPLAKLGTNDPDNLQTLCKRCNSIKGDATKDYRSANVDPPLIQRRTNEGASCPSESPFSESPFSESPIPYPPSPTPSPLPDGSEMRASPSTAVLFAIEARKRGIACNGHDPRLASIAERGVGVEAFCAACDEARKGRESERITLALPLRILESWTEQASRITANGATAPPARAPTAAERAAANVASLTGRNRNPPPVTIDAESAAPTARLG